MKRIAAITMVRNDNFYLRKWVEYYGVQLGKDNLFIYFDGLDQDIPSFCEGTHAEKIDKIGKDVVSNDKGRVAVMSTCAAALFADGYDMVIGTDCDEIIIPDPSTGCSLSEFLDKYEGKAVISPLGLDVGQKIGEEEPIDESVPFLRQRHYAQIGTRYSKASILCAPLTWGSGFHRVKGHDIHIAKDLYLFHFGYFDMGRIQERFKDFSRLEQGWERHLRKRSRTCRLVTELPSRDFDKWTGIARRLQAVCRPPYAWNKPGMLGLKIVVRIPERFQDLV